MSDIKKQRYHSRLDAFHPMIELYNLWQFGYWTRLAQIQTIQNEEQLALKASAQLQLGQIEQVKQTLKDIPERPSEQTAKLLISGVFNTLGKAHAILEDKENSEKNFKLAIESYIGKTRSKHIIQARKNEQLAQLNKCTRWISLDSYDQRGQIKKLFIDCGGHDGCSTIKFKLSNPGYEIITFEGNPELWPYYENLPTQLIKKLVSNYTGEIEFIIDPVDADGSSIVKEKNIDFHKEVKNEDCPVIVMPCIDLSEFIREKAKYYQEIVLKLDVEGAEYAILEKMHQDDTLKYITKLYAEFHWYKIDMPKEQHDALIEKLNPFFEIEEWDAAEFSVHKKGISNKKIRQQILKAIN
ncbi:FkbM family methyltransferase [Alteromonas sp. RKMC-009]|uniref:FkbM family methyltransferase n=1 Tax=Alteromonas sp. RKMC-009 TaxID=2267264 RepID=UPI000E681908|nr:FkbM family methyltransferase [Alteromonas sp. RKMC-009]AYA62996.1 FkbM family methyltransferase [Alteromonas sp. RKMC-009]